ncbi:hypothetical protein RJ639_031507 [Escallonia herrerae]|uniref:Uncharacterized protein n=1 Tax=Escallonia herrerae TaxID=1293975 RepID=A0AA88X1G4_9ASTE|nr:hypothetical protein RJ639_031507 [Escallonia herrerae]
MFLNARHTALLHLKPDPNSSISSSTGFPPTCAQK